MSRDSTKWFSANRQSAIKPYSVFLRRFLALMQFLEVDRLQDEQIHLTHLLLRDEFQLPLNLLCLKNLITAKAV